MKNLKSNKEAHPISNFTINSKSSLEQYKISPEDLNKQRERKEKIKYMYSLYDKYITTYFSYYKMATLNEFDELKSAFPNVEFFTEFRIKGRNSYKKKVIKKIDEGYTGKIYDLYGCKIVIESYTDENGNKITDEDALIAKTMEISDFLQKKQSLETDEGVCKTETVHTKDYITTPKESGYQSYHILRHLTFLKTHKDTPDISFYTEVQVKTENMYFEEQYGEKFGHASTYKNNRNSILKNSKNIKDDVPRFLKLSYDAQSQKYDIVPFSFNKCFQRFFGIDYSEYQHNTSGISEIGWDLS